MKERYVNWKSKSKTLALFVLTMMCLSACATKPLTNVCPKAKATSNFLICVADEWEQEILACTYDAESLDECVKIQGYHGPCTKAAIGQWEKMVE